MKDFMLNGLAQGIMQELKQNLEDDEAFLGGSLRFGITTMRSDIDIFIYSAATPTFLAEWGVEKKKRRI